MPINITVLNQKFFNQFKNGVGFTDNLTDYTNNLTGSVQDIIKFTYDIDISWSAAVSSSDTWTNDGVALTITRTNGNWFTDGFSVGDLCKWLQLGISNANITITSISQDGKTFTYTVQAGAITDSNNASLQGVTPLTGMNYKFGLIGNSESFNVESKVSENDQGYYGSNIGFDTGGGVRDTNFVNLLRLGTYSDWETGTMKVRFVSNPSAYVQRFEIEHVFMIVPYYLDGEISNLQNNIIPNLLNGLNSLKYSFSPGFRTVLSNPNTEKAIVVNSNNLGSVAWFNENFNGFQNDYNVKSVAYADALTLASADGLLIGSKTRVIIIVERLSGVFAGAERFGAYVSYLPEQNEYQDTLTTLTENFIYDSAFNNAGLPFVTGSDFITSLNASVIAGDLWVILEVDYSATQKAFLSTKLSQNAANFIIGIEVGDVSLPSGSSDKVNLLADVKAYDESADIPDLMNVTKFDIYQHDKQIGIDAPSTDSISWNEDGVVIDFDFNLDLNKLAVLKTLDFKLIAFNTVTQQYFELDSYTYNISSAIVSGGVQQLSIATTRGYILKVGDQFNDVTINVGSNVGGIQSYNGRLAQKFSWQDWLQNINADTIFFDGSKPENNLNFKSSNYSDLNNYQISLSIFANLDGINQFNVSGNTNYLFVSPNIKIYDYALDGNITPIWSATIETFNYANASNLGGAILTGQDTLFKTTWINSGGAVTTLFGFYGINRIEETNELGYQITEISSLNDPAANQLLIPSSGTLLNVYLSGGNVVMECLIDGSLVAAGQSYNLSSRIHDGNIIVEGKITEAGVLKSTEAGIQKIIEQ